MPDLAGLAGPSPSRVLSEGASFLVPTVGERPGLYLIPAPLQARGTESGSPTLQMNLLGFWANGGEAVGI